MLALGLPIPGARARHRVGRNILADDSNRGELRFWIFLVSWRAFSPCLIRCSAPFPAWSLPSWGFSVSRQEPKPTVPENRNQLRVLMPL